MGEDGGLLVLTLSLPSSLDVDAGAALELLRLPPPLLLDVDPFITLLAPVLADAIFGNFWVFFFLLDIGDFDPPFFVSAFAFLDFECAGGPFDERLGLSSDRRLRLPLAIAGS